MSSYREIVTKAVIGKGKKTSKSDYTIETEESPNTVLGCWIINHSFNGFKKNDTIVVDGSFDINVWYAHNNDSKTSVCTRTFKYEEDMKMDKASNTSDVTVRCLRQPTVTSVDIKNGIVNISIEKEMGVELVGDTKVKISVEDEEDDYVDLTVQEEIDEELDEITDDYLN